VNLLEPYLEFARKAFAREATYRVEVFTNVGSLILRVYLLRSLWTALYRQNAAPVNIPLHAMITYATVALLMSLVLEVDGTRAIREKIREGTIATDLMKPIVLPLYFFSDGFGQTIFHAMLIVPSLAIALFLVHVDVPSLAALAAFTFSFVLGYLVNFFLNFLDPRDVCGAVDGALGFRSVRRPTDPARFLPGHLRHDRVELAFCGNLLNAAADLYRRTSSFSLGGRVCNPTHVARRFRCMRGAALAPRGTACSRSGRVRRAHD